MIFNSVTFLIFLFSVICCFWTLPARARLWLVFSASLTFYGFWKPEFLILLLFSTTADYIISLKIQSTGQQEKRRLLVITSLFINLGLLLYFKYLLFFLDNAETALNFFGVEYTSPALSIILPLGISFYTFQTISYTVDVYRKVIPAQRDFVAYACYVTFFPQLIAGPILRAGEVIHQFQETSTFKLNNIVLGFRRLIYGLFLKVVLADNISPFVDQGFSAGIENLSALDVITLAFLFGFQIYFDFSAYSHIAIGAALMMGINFPENFNFPYISKSPREFWQRWHISLSSWIRDYLYLPLLGVKVRSTSTGGLASATQKNQEVTRNSTAVLFLTWSIMGLWHGANWTFLIWGVYHAFFIMLYRYISPYTSHIKSRFFDFFSWGLTLFVCMLGWIPFRAENLGDTYLMYSKLFQVEEYFYLGLKENIYLITGLLLLFFIVTYFIYEKGNKLFFTGKIIYSSLQIILLTFAISMIFIYLRPINQFIYFQF